MGLYCRLEPDRDEKLVKRNRHPWIIRGTACCKPLTTFVLTDAHTFQEVVQRLTGPSETNAAQEGAATKIMGVKKANAQEKAIL